MARLARAAVAFGEPIRPDRVERDNIAGFSGGVDTQENTDTQFHPLTDTPRSSDFQGIGKSPGFKWPFRHVTQFLVPKVYKQGAVGATAAGRELPSRPEKRAWAAAYLANYEQTNRHAWPGTPGAIIEHPESVALTRLMQELDQIEPPEQTYG